MTDTLGTVKVGVQVDLTTAEQGFQRVEQRAQATDRALGQSMQNVRRAVTAASTSVAASSKVLSDAMVAGMSRANAASDVMVAGMARAGRAASAASATLAAAAAANRAASSSMISGMSRVNDASRLMLEGMSASGKAAAATAMAVGGAARAHGQYSTQAMAAFHSARAMAEGLAMGVPPSQILMMQMNHLSYAATGPGGIVGAFSQVGKQMREMAASFAGLITPTTALIGGLAAAAGGAYLISKSYEAYARQLDDVARAAGVAADELARMQNVAAFHGVSQSDFFGAVSKFAQSVYSARDGMGSLGQLLRANGQRARDFADAMGKVADLVMRARDDQQRLQILQQAGLPATMEYVRMMQDGAAGLRAQREEAARFGNTFDRNMIEKAHEFDQAWNKAWENFKVYTRGSIQEARDGIDKLNQSLGDWLRSVLPFGLGQVTRQSARASIAAGMGTRLTTQMAGEFYRSTGAGRGAQPPVDPNVLMRNLQLEQQRVGILGELATVEDKVRAVEIRIQQARLSGVNVTAQEASAIVNLTRAQAEYDQLTRQTAAGVFNLSDATKAAGDQLRAWVDQKLLDPTNAREMANAQEILAARTRALKQAALDANPVLKAQRDAEFELAQALRSSADAAAAATARSLYGEDYLAHINDAAPRLVALTSHIKDARDMAAQFGTTLVQGLVQGKSASEVLNSALADVESTLIDMVVKQLVNQAFGSLLSAGGAGGLGGGAGSPLNLLSFLVPGIGHAGGVGGELPSSGRVIPSDIFVDAPRFHSGRFFGPSEMPAIIDKREVVGYPAQMAAKYGGSKVQVNVVNNAGAEVSVGQPKDDGSGGVSLDIMVDRATAKNLTRPGTGTSDALRNRYGVTPSLTRR